MQLRDLDGRASSSDVILLQTPSVKLQMFMEDKLRSKLHSSQDSIIEITDKKDLKEKLKPVVGVEPPFTSKWFVKVDLDKFYDKDLVSAIKESTTCLFFCLCGKYKTFKTFKDDLKSVSVVDFYITYLRRNDFVYLYDVFVPKDKRLDNNLFNYVVKGYSGDLDAVLQLFLELNKGTVFKSRKAISDLIGIGGLSIDSFIFSLLKPLSGSDKGLKTVIKNRLKEGTDMSQSYSIRTMYKFMSNSIWSMIQLKQLMLNGIVYSHIHDLPECYDEKVLSRYQRYIWRLKEIPLSHLLLIKQCMGEKTWTSSVDLIGFIYRYYEQKALNLLR